jgi:uncharacterized protein (TIGR03067 family)
MTMIPRLPLLLRPAAASSALILALTLAAQTVEPGFKSLFNGKDLTGWRGRTNHWSVQDGAITGITTAENPAQGNTFLIAMDGDQPLVVGDFELRFSYKFTGPFGNSGAQYRSRDKGNFVVNGYQADFEVGPTFSGILYEEGGRGILAERGKQVVVREANGKTQIDVTGAVGDSAAIQATIQTNGWNDYVVIAQGNHLQHFINGRQTVDVRDEQAAQAAASGILALQLHAGPPMKVQFKNLRIKAAPSGARAASDDLKNMAGQWKPVSALLNGEAVPNEELAKLSVFVTGDHYRVEGPVQDNGTMALDASRSPRTMDLTVGEGPSAGTRIQAIYTLQGDLLQVCYATDGGARPSKFEAPAGSSLFLAVYRRVKS